MLPQEGLRYSALRPCFQQLWAKDKMSTTLPSSKHKGPCTVPMPEAYQHAGVLHLLQRCPFHLCLGASTPAGGH